MIKIKLVFVSFLSCLGCQIGLAQQTIVLKIQLPGYPFILPGLSTMAFSFTLDDGYRSAFTCAYPLLNGELVSPSYLMNTIMIPGATAKVQRDFFIPTAVGIKSLLD